MAVKLITGALTPGPPGPTGPKGDTGAGSLLDLATVSVSVKNAPYNAKGDGKIIGGAAIASGSHSLSVTGGFVSGDAGKHVIVSGAGAGGAVVATLSADVPVGAFSSLSVNALAADMPADTYLIVSGSNREKLVTADLSAGATTLNGLSGFAHVIYPAGSTIQRVGDPLSTTISSVSGGVATLADPAGSTVGAEGAWVCYGTGDAAAIQAAIDAVDGNVRGRVVFDDGIYMIEGALQTSHSTFDGGSSTGYRSQIALPLRGVTFAPKGVVVLEAATPGGGQPTIRNGLDATGVILQSTLVGLDATGGIPSVIGGPVDTSAGAGDLNITNTHVEVRGVNIRCPANPSIAGLNLQKCQTAKLRDVRVDTMEEPSGYDPPPLMKRPTHPTGIGVLMPMNDCQSGDVAQLHVNGFYAGLATGEHTIGDYVFIFSCYLGLDVYPSYHANSLGYADIEQCAYTIGYSDPTTGIAALLATPPSSHLAIAMLDIEDKDSPFGFPAWSRPVAHINDPGDVLHGTINFHRVLAGTGVVTGALTLNGATNVTLVRQ